MGRIRYGESRLMLSLITISGFICLINTLNGARNVAPSGLKACVSFLFFLKKQPRCNQPWLPSLGSIFLSPSSETVSGKYPKKSLSLYFFNNFLSNK